MRSAKPGNHLKVLQWWACPFVWPTVLCNVDVDVDDAKCRLFFFSCYGAMPYLVIYLLIHVSIHNLSTFICITVHLGRTEVSFVFLFVRGKGTSVQQNVRKSQTVLDPFTPWIQVSRYLNSHSLSVELGFKHPNRSRNSGFQKQKFSIFRNQDHLT